MIHSLSALHASHARTHSALFLPKIDFYSWLPTTPSGQPTTTAQRTTTKHQHPQQQHRWHHQHRRRPQRQQTQPQSSPGSPAQSGSVRRCSQSAGRWWSSTGNATRTVRHSRRCGAWIATLLRALASQRRLSTGCAWVTSFFGDLTPRRGSCLRRSRRASRPSSRVCAPASLARPARSANLTHRSWAVPISIGPSEICMGCRLLSSSGNAHSSER